MKLDIYFVLDSFKTQSFLRNWIYIAAGFWSRADIRLKSLLIS